MTILMRQSLAFLILSLAACSRERPAAVGGPSGSPTISESRATYTKPVDVSQKDFISLMSLYHDTKRNLRFSLDRNREFCSNHIYISGQPTGVWPFKGAWQERVYLKATWFQEGQDGARTTFIQIEGLAEERKDEDGSWQSTRSFVRAEPVFMEAAHSLYLHLAGERSMR